MRTSLTLCFLASTFFFVEAVRDRHSNVPEKAKTVADYTSLVRDMERLNADEKELHYTEKGLFDEYAELASTIGKCNAILIRISRTIYIPSS